MLTVCRNIPCGIIEFVLWYIMGLVIKAQKDNVTSDGFKLQCIVTDTFF